MTAHWCNIDPILSKLLGRWAYADFGLFSTI
jgi:hypothetical protein